MRNGDLKIVSWNVQGLNHPIKRRKVLEYLRSKNCDIALLQETHLNDKESTKLKRDWVGEVIFAPAVGKKAGTAILLRRSLEARITRQESDSVGRWSEVVLEVNDKRLLILNVYAPNQSTPDFWKGVMERTHSTDTDLYVVGGDFNLPLNPLIDRSSNVRFAASKAHGTLGRMLKSRILVDPWRTCNPTSREYTFYSAVHKTYSRIDYLLTSPALLPMVLGARIFPILLSDHAPVELTLDLDVAEKPDPQWRFSAALLDQAEFRDRVRDTTELFFAENRGSVNRMSTLWDAYKATLRGMVISYTAHRKRQALAEERAMEKAVSRLEAIHANNPANGEALHNLLTKRYALNTLISKRTRTAHLRDSAVLFGESNRAGKMLANYLKARESRKRIAAIQTEDGTLVMNDNRMLEEFHRYYALLYTSETCPSDSVMEDFFKDIVLPSLEDQDKESLEHPLSLQEVLEAIGQLPNGKAPGPDGLTAEFYKAFRDVLAPYLLELFNKVSDDPNTESTFHLATTKTGQKSDLDTELPPYLIDKLGK